MDTPRPPTMDELYICPICFSGFGYLDLFINHRTLNICRRPQYRSRPRTRTYEVPTSLIRGPRRVIQKTRVTPNIRDYMKRESTKMVGEMKIIEVVTDDKFHTYSVG